MAETTLARDADRGAADPKMTQTTDSSRVLAFPDRSARLVLDQHATGRGRLDGGWWPRSRDAREQLPELVAALNERLGTVLRLAVDALAWDGIPHRIEVAGHVVRIGWFTDMNHLIVVTLGRREHLLLLVVPPTAGEQAARKALALSAHSGSDGAQETLELCSIETEPVTRLSARPIKPAA